MPELVLSNFSTPLGLSTGRLLQSIFPPLPQIVGRQVVAIHNQRDFIFFRRFRYMFALRETEESRKAAKTQGRDEDLRTRMQEIGPRFTLKLRWLKRGALGTGRRKGGTGRTVKSLLIDSKFNDHDETQEIDEVDSQDNIEQDLTEEDKDDEAAAQEEMLQQLEGIEPSLSIPSIGYVNTQDEPQPVLTPSNAAISSVSSEIQSKEPIQDQVSSGKRKRTRMHSPGGTIHIPEFTMPVEILKSEMPHQRKLKRGASVLDTLAVTVGYGRGGTKNANKEWEWNPRMQVSRRKFVL